MKYKLLIDTIYLITSFIGATIVAANINAAALGYGVFIISSATGLYIALNSNVSRSVVAVNVMFGAINIFGLIRHTL